MVHWRSTHKLNGIQSHAHSKISLRVVQIDRTSQFSTEKKAKLNLNVSSLLLQRMSRKSFVFSRHTKKEVGDLSFLILQFRQSVQPAVWHQRCQLSRHRLCPQSRPILHRLVRNRTLLQAVWRRKCRQ